MDQVGCFWIGWKNVIKCECIPAYSDYPVIQSLFLQSPSHQLPLDRIGRDAMAMTSFPGEHATAYRYRDQRRVQAAHEKRSNGALWQHVAA